MLDFWFPTETEFKIIISPYSEFVISTFPASS